MMTASRGPRAHSAVAIVSLLCLSWLPYSTLDSSIGESVVLATLNKTNHTALNHTSPISLPPLDNILFVNIRKSGGNEIKSGIGCFTSKKEKLTSTLSTKITSCIHTESDTKPKGTIPTVDAYLYNLRHPIDRLLSWYLFEHPSSCTPKRRNRKACQAHQDVVKHKHGYAAQFYVDCFPSQEYLSYAFTTHVSKECNELFYRVMNNEPGFRAGFREKPFKYDLRYYTNKTIDQYPNKTVLVIRSQVVFQDLYDLKVLMGGNGTFRMKETYHDHLSSDELSRSYRPLCRKMREELYEYRRLIQLAANFDESTKQAIIDGAANRCGFSSWKQMEQTMKSKAQHQGNQDTL